MEFFVHLEKEQYGAAGWPIPVATLPGAHIEKLLIEGKAQNLEGDWVLQDGHLRIRSHLCIRSGATPKADGNVLIVLKSKLVPVWISVIVSVAIALLTSGAIILINGAGYCPPVPVGKQFNAKDL